MRWGPGTPLFEEAERNLRRSAATTARDGRARGAYCDNLSIARGLDYYTGIVYETTLDAHPQIGSICSRALDDNLASHYTKSKFRSWHLDGLTVVLPDCAMPDSSAAPTARSMHW
jgi:histidyl-tRNA synthetase